jgi:hypothetical protein
MADKFRVEANGGAGGAAAQHHEHLGHDRVSELAQPAGVYGVVRGSPNTDGATATRNAGVQSWLQQQQQQQQQHDPMTGAAAAPTTADVWTIKALERSSKIAPTNATDSTTTPNSLDQVPLRSQPAAQPPTAASHAYSQFVHAAEDPASHPPPLPSPLSPPTPPQRTSLHTSPTGPAMRGTPLRLNSTLPPQIPIFRTPDMRRTSAPTSNSANTRHGASSVHRSQPPSPVLLQGSGHSQSSSYPRRVLRHANSSYEVGAGEVEEVQEDFDSEFQRTLDDISDEFILKEEDNFRRLSKLVRDFRDAALTYGKVIVAEHCLPEAQKTVKQANLPGFAGGEKYMAAGILFRLAVDSRNLYGSDEFAAKEASHQLRGLTAMYNANVDGLHFPLLALIDFRGYR